MYIDFKPHLLYPIMEANHIILIHLKNINVDIQSKLTHLYFESWNDK